MLLEERVSVSAVTIAQQRPREGKLPRKDAAAALHAGVKTRLRQTATRA